MAEDILDTPIEFLKGIGPARAATLQMELGIYRFRDLVHYYPFRYVDRTAFQKIAELHPDLPVAQIKGKILTVEVIQAKGRRSRMVALLSDDTGMIELQWFSGIKWIQNQIKKGEEYIIFGKPNFFGQKISISHPEIEKNGPQTGLVSAFDPVYSTSEKAKNAGFSPKGIAKIVKTFFATFPGTFPETLPAFVVEKFRLISRDQALKKIHLPQSGHDIVAARARLKFEELFFLQLRLLQARNARHAAAAGWIFTEVDGIFTRFYNEGLPFSLTNAQKKVLKEIRQDVVSGRQMNRLVQGDVGSGKTIVALMSMLMALNNGFQSTLLAPTEILATQHFQGLSELATPFGIRIGLLTGSTKTAGRKKLLESLEAGETDIIVGTHALLEDRVVFKNLGLAVIDEQHRFGVAQRATLWRKNPKIPPHILVMTATPIPRTLAMTLYGDLDVSVIDELPPGRKPITTLHKYDSARLEVFGTIRREIQQGRQCYVVYPLIEESETQDYKDLMDGYESITRAFPEYAVSIVHGKMKADAKEFEMRRFVKGETKIMVATTVIEVGVNVPNATVMVIESAEKFGLSQLHQLRGRVGRGGDQSYCILMSSYKLSEPGKKRLQTMVETNDGFRISEVDMELRGPGDIEGLRQSGELKFRIADIIQDQKILVAARNTAQYILDEDPQLSSPANAPLKAALEAYKSGRSEWSKIS